jgi:hypothetical protein
MMRKMIMMAIAGFIWKKIQARMFTSGHVQKTTRRF